MEPNMIISSQRGDAAMVVLASIALVGLSAASYVAYSNHHTSSSSQPQAVSSEDSQLDADLLKASTITVDDPIPTIN